jgi:hypothetical protein
VAVLVRRAQEQKTKRRKNIHKHVISEDNGGAVITESFGEFHESNEIRIEVNLRGHPLECSEFLGRRVSHASGEGRRR